MARSFAEFTRWRESGYQERRGDWRGEHTLGYYCGLVGTRVQRVQGGVVYCAHGKIFEVGHTLRFRVLWCRVQGTEGRMARSSQCKGPRMGRVWVYGEKVALRR